MGFLRHLSGYAPARLSHAIAAFGGVYVFTRLLGPEDYGRYALLVSLLALVHTASAAWAEAGAYRFGAGQGARSAKAGHFALALRMIGAAALMGLACFLALWFALRGMPEYSGAMPLLALLFAAGCLVQLAQETHRAGLNVARYSLNETFHILGGFLIGAALAWQTGLGALAPLVGLLASRLVIASREGAWLFGQARGGRVAQGAGRAWRAYGVPVAVALVLDLVLSASDRFLIAAVLGEAAVGAYAAGYGIADKTVLMMCAWPAIAASPLLMARYEAAGAAAAGAEASKLITAVLFVALPATTGLALVAEPLSEAVIGAPLRGQAAEIIPWIAIAGLLNGLLVYVASEPYQLSRRTGLRAALMAVPAILNIVLNLILLPRFGLMGAVYATVISYAIGFFVLASAGRRLVPLAWPWMDAAKLIACCLAMAPAVWAAPNVGGWAQLLLEAGCGAAVYFSAAFVLDVAGVRAFVIRRAASETGHQT
ncbi:MAG: polysaccharide biosynthesis C-terminal domain-containing protein [Pseudomonadota bacterium]